MNEETVIPSNITVFKAKCSLCCREHNLWLYISFSNLPIGHKITYEALNLDDGRCPYCKRKDCMVITKKII